MTPGSFLVALIIFTLLEASRPRINSLTYSYPAPLVPLNDAPGAVV
jgi:hypothetical protein